MMGYHVVMISDSYDEVFRNRMPLPEFMYEGKLWLLTFGSDAWIGFEIEVKGYSGPCVQYTPTISYEIKRHERDVAGSKSALDIIGIGNTGSEDIPMWFLAWFNRRGVRMGSGLIRYYQRDSAFWA